MWGGWSGVTVREDHGRSVGGTLGSELGPLRRGGSRRGEDPVEMRTSEW